MIGQYGESVTSFYLRNKGFSVLYRNLRLNEGTIRGEIDILALKDRVIHIIEVKTACVKESQDVIFAPESNLSHTKIRKLRKLRSLLIMKMSGGELLVEIPAPSVSKVVITGVVVYLYIDANKGNDIKTQVCRIKIKEFHDL